MLLLETMLIYSLTFKIRIPIGIDSSTLPLFLSYIHKIQHQLLWDKLLQGVIVTHNLLYSEGLKTYSELNRNSDFNY